MNDMNEKHRSVLYLTDKEAKDFFLKGSSYCTLALPEYFNFDPLLVEVSKILSGKDLSSFYAPNKKVKDCNNVNYRLLNNKDGKYAWRPQQLINPAIYVALVNKVTSPKNWETVQSAFEKFQYDKKISCASIPVQSLSIEKDKAEMVSQWYLKVEQRSIALALEYKYVFHSDISDCYGSIYTHSISWALHTKEVAQQKKNRNKKSLLGVAIDIFIRDMNLGQSNGIPQGSLLMDFIAEMVLGYIDYKLSKRIKEADIEDYFIIRYRDDYRVFTNTPMHGEQILRILTEVLIAFGMKLKPEKTIFSDDVIRSSIKDDKLYWLERKKITKNLRKNTLIIHNLAKQYPNSGSLEIALSDFFNQLLKRNLDNEPKTQIISIIVDIAFHNPRTFPMSCAILGYLISALDTDEEKECICKKIIAKFQLLPNMGYLELWFQRVSIDFLKDAQFSEPLTELVNSQKVSIWSTEWIKNGSKLKRLLNNPKIIDEHIKEKVGPKIPREKMGLFNIHYY